jgi:hypothetical protein
MLAVQEKAARIQSKIEAIAADLDSLILVEQRDVLVDASPPMLPYRYFSQFGIGLCTPCKTAWMRSHGPTAGSLHKTDGSFSSRVSFFLSSLSLSIETGRC